ncbi:Terminase small subunit [Vibrio crassostreae]|nr:Terminase small subunit [Vibrio crassostreae]
MNNEKRLWNLTELEAFDYHRSTIRKKLKSAGIEPIAYKGNIPLYDVVQVAPYLCKAMIKESDAPDLMGFKTAAELRAYIQSEREKLALLTETGECVDKADYELEIGTCLASVKSFKEKVITRVESAITSATPQELEYLDKLLNFDLKAIADELENF